MHAYNYKSNQIYLQYYREYGADTRFVDLGLQTHRIKCRVHNDFKSVKYCILYDFKSAFNRLIIIAEKKEVYDRFPTPLINRLEKHIVDTSTVLNERQKKVLILIKRWIEEFNSVPNYEYVEIAIQSMNTHFMYVGFSLLIHL